MQKRLFDMQEFSTKKLELDKILSLISDRATLEGGKKRCLEIEPEGDIEKVRDRLDFTDECFTFLYRKDFLGVPAFSPCETVLATAEKGGVLSMGDLLCVGDLLYSSRFTAEAVEKSGLSKISEFCLNLCSDESLEKDIRSKIASEKDLFDTASDKLFEIRSGIRSCNEQIRSSLSSFLTGEDAKYLQEPIVTIRDDRFVLPVKAENRGKIKGFVHDRSNTGATLFVEPEKALELNNELATLKAEEKAEIAAILKKLSERVGTEARALAESEKILEGLDSRLAVARYSYETNGVYPKINDKGFVNIIAGRHPLIDKERVVPVSLNLGGDFRILLLSGANTGGKTVTLKIVGLFCLMAACGVFVPAGEGTEVSVFDSVFCDMGDSQSIENNLSTFSSHMTDIVHITENATKQSLVLLDELCGGTDPDEGQAIAKAVTKKFLEIGCAGVVTTHYSALKEYAKEAKGIENAAMEFDTETLMPRYRVKMGMAGSSNALSISKKLGLADDVLSDAYENLSESGKRMETLTRRMESEIAESERTKAEAERIKREYERRLAETDERLSRIEKEESRIQREADERARRKAAEMTAKAEVLLERMEEIAKKRDEITERDLIEARTRMHEMERLGDEERKADAGPSIKKESLKIGDEVFVKSLGSYGKVTDIKKNGDIEVTAGFLKTYVKIEDLSEGSQRSKKMERDRVRVERSLDAPMLEINVIGMDSYEAVTEVADFLDKAVMDNLESVKIIHGKGTGKLRREIESFLKKSSVVESFRSGEYGEGETGVTIVKLK